MENYCDIIEAAKCLGKTEFIGETELGRRIPLVHIGNAPKVLLIASVHAREHITTDLLNRLLADEKEIEGVSLDYLPVLNIDGVLLAKNGIESVENDFLRRNLLSVNGSNDFSLWKANINCVDLNVNFDADWGEGSKNITIPAGENYIGRYPESEKETRVVVELLKRNYSLIVCYHSLGEEVYWGYESNFRHYAEARTYANKLGYKLKRSENSTGGIKDYYCLNYSGLGLTVEVGEEVYGHPYPIEKLDLITEKHRGSIKLLCGLGESIYAKLYERSAIGSAQGV